MSSRNRLFIAASTVFALLLAACEKVPIQNIGARFTRSDVVWFEDEETLFVFYKVEAEQGLNPQSQIEVTYTTDDGVTDWVDLATLTAVHPHVAVDCGPYTMCGSTSLRVKKEPRDVGVRLRYHHDGALALDSSASLFSVRTGPPELSRSLVVYGVFDAANAHVQWRARHQFPNLHNEEIQSFGLRRYFRVESPRWGDVPALPGNPYRYAFAARCPTEMTALGWAKAETTTRAIFAKETVPVVAFDAPVFCGQSTVIDAKGTFTAAAVAAKNPQVRAAFPSVHSPVKENIAVGFTLRPCRRTISDEHLAMQKQRLLLESSADICDDDWRDPAFKGQLVETWRKAIDSTRLAGKDMVLVLALHHDDTSGVFDATIEAALAQVLPSERDRSSPRVSGAFVFDSYAHTVAQSVARLALWCPANIPVDDLDKIPTTSLRSCPLLPDLPDIVLGPLKASTLAILPTRKQFETYIGKYSAAQAGKMLTLTYSAPEQTAITDVVPIGDFGYASFYNNEAISAAVSDAFSYCQGQDPRAIYIAARIPQAPDSPFPLQSLPNIHNSQPQPIYQLGIGWEFAFLTRLNYEIVIGGAATAFSFTINFGFKAPVEAYYGNEIWKTSEVPLADTLTQCTQFCDSPTFDSGGAYKAAALFRTTYSQVCYRPIYPVFDADTVSQGGYPRDP